MKCCIISTLYPPHIVGGAEKVTARLASALVQAGHSVTVISLHDSSETKIEMVDGVRVYYLPIDNVYWPFKTAAKPSALKRAIWHLIDMWNVKAAARVGKILDDEKPDILHCNNLTGFSVAIWSEAKKRGLKIVHTLHDYSLLCPRGTLFKQGKMCENRCGDCKVFSLPKFIASQWVDHVVGVSHYVSGKHRQFGYFKDAKHDVIRNICDGPSLPKITNTTIEKVFAFGFIGRVEQEKGIEILLQATTLLPHDKWRLFIAGRGRDEYVAALKAKYPNPNVEWLGFCKPDDFYSKIDLSIIPSLWPEPLPGVIPEAAGRNIPVILSNIGGMPEYLQMGVRGIAVPVGDVQCLVNEMKAAILGQGVMKSIQAKISDWQQEMDEKTVVERYVACYQKQLSS